MKLVLVIAGLTIGILAAELHRKNQASGTNPEADEAADPEVPALVDPQPFAEPASPPPARAAEATPPAFVERAPAPPPPSLVPLDSASTPPVAKAGEAPPVAPARPENMKEARLFELTILHAGRTGAVAYGRFYDVAPGALPDFHNPLNVKPGHSLPSDWKSTGSIFVRGITGLADGEKWSGLLLRDGAETYHIPYKGDRMVAAFRIVSAPAPTPHPKEWLWKGGR